MKHLRSDISDERSAQIFSALELPNSGIDNKKARYGQLEPLIYGLTLAELIGLMLQILELDQMRQVLDYLDDLRVLFRTTKNESDAEVAREYDRLATGVPFLGRYCRITIPADVWLEAATAFRKLYVEQLSSGIIPDFRTDGWKEYWVEHHPKLERNLKDRGLSVQQPEMGE